MSEGCGDRTTATLRRKLRVREAQRGDDALAYVLPHRHAGHLLQHHAEKDGVGVAVVVPEPRREQDRIFLTEGGVHQLLRRELARRVLIPEREHDAIGVTDDTAA